jgi:hypothetical protein
MSFIFKDKNILELIYKFADVESGTFSNTKVPAPVIEKLFDNLMSYSPSQSSLLSGEDQWKSATVPSLSSLSACLDHIKLYKIKYSNQEIVPSSSAIMQDPNVGKLYKSYQNYSVYPEGLKNYLELLLTSPDYKNKALYRELLGNLIDEANKAFGLGIKLPDYKDDIIWKFNEKSIDVSESLQFNSGPKPLRVSDLKNMGPWLTGMSIVEHSENIASSDILCRFLQYLYTRDNLSAFHNQILDAARTAQCKWVNQITPSPTTGDKKDAPTVTTSRPEKSEAGSAFGHQLRDLILKDFAPFYSHDQIIFRQGRRGILPFLELTIQYAISTQMSDLANQAFSLKNEFEKIQDFLGGAGVTVFTRSSKPAAVSIQLSKVRKDLRSGFMSQKESQFKQNLDLLLNDIVNRLIDSLNINRSIFTRLQYIEMSHSDIVTGAFLSILQAANIQSPV